MTKERAEQLISHVENLYALSHYSQSNFAEAGILAVLRCNRISFHFRANRRGTQAVYELITGKVCRYRHKGQWHEIRDSKQLAATAEKNFEDRLTTQYEAVQVTCLTLRGGEIWSYKEVV